MRVAAQVQAEMAVVLGRVFGLRLRAQHDLVDEELVLGALHASQDAVEQRRLQRPLRRQLDADRGQHLAQRPHLLERGLVMDAVDQRRACLLQRLGGRDVGEDHELLDQPMRVEPLAAPAPGRPCRRA